MNNEKLTMINKPGGGTQPLPVVARLCCLDA